MRPGCQQLLETVLVGEIDTIVAEARGRLSGLIAQAT